MTIKELLDEYKLSIDDVRWSLCARIAESLREQMENGGIQSLTREIWSGSLSDHLYDLEERWIRERQETLDRGVLDEGHLRDELASMVSDKAKRT